MRWFRKKQKAIIAGILSPDVLECYAVEHNALLSFNAYPLKHHEVTSRIINSQSIKKCLHSFIKEHSLTPRYITFALDQRLVSEQLLPEDKEECSLLCKKQLDQNHWYQASLTPEQRFSYQLFIQELAIPCMLITTTTYSLLSQYIPKATSIEQLKQNLDSWIQKSHSENKNEGIIKGLVALSQEVYEEKI